MSRGPAVRRTEYPRPQLVRADWLCLNGPWSFQVDAGRNGESLGWAAEPRLSEQILVPFCPESRLSGIGRREFMPCVWYARKFSLPRTWKSGRVLLHFGAVDYEATVWVNGRFVGFHRGGYTPFTCEITDALKGRADLLVVRAVDDPHSALQTSGKQCPEYASRGCLYTRVTGIWQTVWLERVGRSYIRSLRMTGQPDEGRIHLQASVNSPRPDLTLQVEVYDLDLTLRDAGGVVDSAASYFGLRSVSIAGPAILLNGRPVFQRLVLDQGYYPAGLYTAPREADLKRDIVLAKSLGFNGARLHQKVFEPRFLYWADRLGYLVWGEYPSWGIDRSQGEALRRFSAEWAEAVLRDVNHPSIVGWCPFNEARDWRDPQMLRDVYRLTKALDPTRPVIDASGWDHYETDVYDSHSYEQSPRKFAALFAAFASGGEPYSNCPSTTPYAGQPYFVSEYGGAWWNPGQGGMSTAWGYGDRPRTKKEFVERYRRLTLTLLRHPRICGFCYTQLYDIEQEVNGLLTYDRKMKFDAKVIAEINARPAAIETARARRSGARP